MSQTDDNGRTRLTALQHRAVEAWLSGMNNTHAAKEIGAGRCVVSGWWQKGHPARNEYDRRVSEVHDGIKQNLLQVSRVGSAALAHMIEGLLSDFDAATDPKVRATIASTVERIASSAGLDRTGHPKVSQVETKDVTERTAGDVRGTATEAAGRLRLVVGGRAESI